MPGIGFTVPSIFTPATPLPLLTWTPPVDDYNARWISTSGWDGTGWEDIVSGRVLAPAGSGTAPSVATVDGRTALSFDGVSNEIRDDTFSMNQPHAFAAVVKVRAFSTTDFALHNLVGGVSLGGSRTSEGGGILVQGTNGLVVHTTANAAMNYQVNPTGWHVILGNFNSGTVTGRVDDIEMTKAMDNVPRRVLAVGGERNNYYSDMAITELMTWNRALTATERNDVVAALAGHHGI